MKVGFIFLLLISSTMLSDYNLVFERTEIVSHNEKYLSNVKVVTFKYNRTQPAVNASMTFKIALGNNMKATFQAYTFLSNEYRTFPLRFMCDVCQAITRNEFGFGRLTEKGNFSGCPMMKGSFYMYYWTPDIARFPPFIPNGMYMFETELTYFSDQIAFTRFYATITRPLGRRH